MNINSTGINFSARVPKIKTPKIKKPNFFRDEELFDPRKDRLTHDYFRYDKDDNSAGINKLFDDFDLSESAKRNCCKDFPAYNDLLYYYQTGKYFEGNELPNIFEQIR